MADNNNNQNNNNTFESPFKSQGEIDTFTQSTSSKAKNELLKSLGIESVEDFKKQQVATAKLSKDSKQKELDEADEFGKLKITHADMAKVLDTANTTIAGLETGKKQQESLLSVLKIPNVKADKATDIITLANSRVTDDVDFTKAVASVIEEYPSFTGQQGETFGFGTDSNSRDQKPSTMQELYDDAKKNGKMKDQIKIKQDAFKKGILVT